MKNAPYHTEKYKGFTINIHHDEDGYSRDPYKDMDGMYPMMIKGDRRTTKQDYYDASAAFFPTTNQYRRHKKALLEVFDIQPQADDSPDDTEDELTDAINDAVKEHDYDKLEDVGRILGVPCLQFSSRGYSQSDWAQLFVVWTPEFAKRGGTTKKEATQESMKANAKYWSAWAWGDVYGFIIEDKDGNEIEDGSCWGFVEPETYPAEKMYVVKDARETVDNHIKWEAEKAAKDRKEAIAQHTAQLKTWIRNHVPVMYREPLRIGA